MLSMRYELTDTLSELLGVEIPERNRNAQLLCPFHDERTPSFSINLDTGQWQCFGCGAMGGINKLARMLGGELDDATRQDILIRGLSRDEEPTVRTNFAPVANGYISALASGPGRRSLRDYLEPRGLPDSVAGAFGLGYDEQRDCLTLPYWDEGTVTGIKFRARDARKYSLDGSTYGLYNVDGLRGRPVVVLGEGESDTHALWSQITGLAGQAGRVQPVTGDNVEPVGAGELHAGVGGTSGAVKSERLWGLWKLDLLFAQKVIVAYDADEAGDEACRVAERVLGPKFIRMRPTMGQDWTDAIKAGENVVERVRQLMA